MIAAEAWTHAAWARLAALLAGRAGLRFPPSRQPAAEQAMRHLMEEERERDPFRFAARVAADARLFGRLVGAVTIGETYFFREPGQLAFLRREVLPSFEGLRSPAEPLRVWSAGCATGEEPYSLAIVLREEGWADRARVLGTEISDARLDSARAGRYTRWSLRGVDEETIGRWFARQGTTYVLHPGIRAMVEYRSLNLAADHWPAGDSGIEEMDVVLCRNVLIYLDRETVSAVADRLLRSLSPEGWLFLGASDPSLQELVPCEVVVTGAGLAYRRSATPGVVAWRPPEPPPPLPAPALDETLETPLLPLPVPDVEPRPDAPPSPAPPPASAAVDVDAALALAAERYAERAYDDTVAAARRAIALGAGDDVPWILLVRALANMGRLADADRACLEALERHRLSAELAYLHAVLLLQAGRTAAAAAAARRALYLDRSLAVAHLTLGAALAREGNGELAVRAFRAAERLLGALPPDAVVPASDGERARRLLEAARTGRRQLGEAA